MANFCSLYAFLVSSIILTSIGQISCAPVQKIMLYHEYSGQFLEGTPSSGPVNATGGISGQPYHSQMCIFCVQAIMKVFHAITGTEFYPQQSGDLFKYESVDVSGKYLIMNNQGVFSIGSTSKGEYLFTRTAVGDFFKLSADVSNTTCYLAFNEDGYQLPNPCSLSSGDEEKAKLKEE